MIEAVVDIRKPELDLRLPAESESLPVVRQALRSLGEAVQADRDALEDAELAVTEGCANVIEHAYGGLPDVMVVTFEPRATEMRVRISDHGMGMPAAPVPGEGRGFGLSMIEGIANRVDISPGAQGGTDLVMSLDMGERLRINGSAPPGAAPLERIARRIVAVIGAQVDLPSDRFVESLLAVELAVRHASAYLLEYHVKLTLDRLSGGFALCLGPLVPDGAHALMHESELPMVGSVIEKLSDEVTFEHAESASRGERLRLRIDGSGRARVG